MKDSIARINNICLIILAATAVTVALIYTKDILVPFVISIFLYLIISPLIAWLQSRLKFPKIAAVAAVLALFLIFSTLVVLIISISLKNFLDGATVYRDRIFDFLRSASEIAKEYGIEYDITLLMNTLRNLPVFSLARNITDSILSFSGKTVLVIVFTIFFIAGETKIRESNQVWWEIKSKVSRYIGTKLLTSTATGVLAGIVLVVFGVDLAFLFAAFTILLNFIPSIGSIIATLLPIPVILLEFGFGWKFTVILILLAIIQLLIGNFIDPKLMGEKLDLHPVTILIFLMFWGLVWGIPGMFLAVPFTSILKLVLSRIETTKPIAELLAGRM